MSGRLSSPQAASISRQRSPSEEGEEPESNPDAPDEPPLPDEEPPLPEEEPPLPDEELPLPDEHPPDTGAKHEAKDVDDGWEARYDANTGGWYFFNRFTLKTQWENPRVPEGPGQQTSDTTATATIAALAPAEPYTGYNPKIHGDYDPNADYAKFHEDTLNGEAPAVGTAGQADETYEQTANFNRFTGKFQSQDRGAEYHNDENKSHRQMSAFFDVDKAASAHDGKSLKAERAGRKLSKKEAKEYNQRRKAKKEAKRREFLMS